MTTLGNELGFSENWSPLDINIESVKKMLAEVTQKHDVADPNEADSLSKRILAVADTLSTDLTKLRLYFVAIRTKAKDRFNDVKQSAIDEKSDAGKERVALCDVEFRKMRDEYKKAELLVTHLEIKFRELMSYHYSFKDTARRLSGLKFATSGSSDSSLKEEFGLTQLPVAGDEAKKDEDTF